MRGDPHHAIFSRDVLLSKKGRDPRQASSRTRHEAPPLRQNDVGHGVLDGRIGIVGRKRIGLRREQPDREDGGRHDIHKDPTESPVRHTAQARPLPLQFLVDLHLHDEHEYE